MDVCKQSKQGICSSPAYLLTTHAAAADWANLTPNICQQVLCRDMYTFFAGALVCKAWNTNIQCSQAGPRCMDFAESVQLPAKHTNNIITPGFVLQKFRSHAPADLKELKVAQFVALDLRRAQAVLEDFCTLAGPFQHLAVLELHFSVIDDWSPFFTLPDGLVSLVLSRLTGSRGDKYNSLEGFNRFRKLEVLKLEFCDCSVFHPENWGRYKDAAVVAGELNLPSLQILHLMADEEKVALVSECFTGIPSSCQVSCSDLLGRLQIAACDRLQRSDIVGDSCCCDSYNKICGGMRDIFYDKEDSHQLFEMTTQCLYGRSKRSSFAKEDSSSVTEDSSSFAEDSSSVEEDSSAVEED